MVSGRRGARRADARLRRRFAPGRRSGGGEALRFRGREADPFASRNGSRFATRSWRYAGIDLFDSLRATAHPIPTGSPLAAAGAGHAGLRVAADDTWSDMFSRLLSRKVEPNLGIGRPTFLYRLSRQRSGARAALAPRPASRRAIRTLRLRRRARQRLRRTDRRARAAPPLRGGHGAESASIYGESLSDRRRFSRRALHECPSERRRARLRPARDARLRRRTTSRTCNGRRFRSGRAMNDRTLMERAREALHRVYGFPGFRPGQEEILSRGARRRGRAGGRCRPAAASRCCSSCRRSLTRRPHRSSSRRSSR